MYYPGAILLWVAAAFRAAVDGCLRRGDAVGAGTGVKVARQAYVR